MEKKGFIKYVLDYFNEVEGASDENTEKFLDVKTSDGRILRIGSEELAVGSTVKEMTEDGSVIDIENGAYLLDDEKTTITIEDGVISNIDIKEEEAPADKAPEGEGDDLGNLPTFNNESADLHDNCKCTKVDGQIVAGADACDYCNSLDGEKAFEKFNKLTEDFVKLTEDNKELIIKLEKLEKEYKELAEKPSAKPTVIDGDFSKETLKNKKPLSVLHSMINL